MDTLWVILYTSVVLVVLQYIYRYLKKPFSYWEERDVASVPALPLIGSLYENFAQDFHVVMVKRYKKYGKLFGFYESTRPVLSIADPELMKDVLVKDFPVFPNRREFSFGEPLFDKMVSAAKGEEWKRIRTIISPAFSSGRIKRLSSILTEISALTAKNFEKCADRGEPADCKKLYGTYTMDVIARAAFGTKLDSHNDPENEFVKNARVAFQGGVTWKFILFLLVPKVLKFFRMSVFSYKAANFFRNVTLRILEQRRKTGQKQNDFLQLLMDAADEAASTETEEVEDDAEKAVKDFGHDQDNKQVFQQTKKYKNLSHDELIAQCVLFFLAGYDTTASTLSFASYLLALNPDKQEILIKEVDETLKKNQNKMTYEAVQSMRYLENVIWETLRIFPPAVSTDRKAEEDYDLGSTGIKVPKGMIVQFPIYAMHHDPELYEDPENFEPDRFLPEEKIRRNPYTYLPFGAGPRNCVGMRFALIEIKFCLVTLLSKFRFRRGAETKVPLQLRSGQGLLQPRGIILDIERRKDCVMQFN